MDKKILRKSLLDIRREIPDKKIKSTIIVNKIIHMDKYINANVVALYKALKNEVNLDYLINYSLNRGKIVLLPRVVGDNLVFIKINSDTKYDISNFGGDTDTNSDIVGQLIGPLIGFQNFGNKDLELILNHVSPSRFQYSASMAYFFVDYLEKSKNKNFEKYEKNIPRFNYIKNLLKMVYTNIEDDLL